MRSVRHVMGTVLVFGAVVLSVGLFGVGESSGDVLGTFRWRFEPFCNVVKLTVIEQGPAILLSGSDDGCGLVPTGAASGTLFVNAGSVGGSVAVTTHDGITINSFVQLNLATGSGSWRDDFGRQGTFIFEPTAAPGSPRPVVRDEWAYVISNAGLHASSSSNITATHPATGEYCVLIPKRSSHKAAQATLANPGGSHIVSVGTGHGSACNPLVTDTQDAVPVYVRTSAGVAVDGNFTIFIPAR